MAEERKTRADFDTDSEWYTYLVTHPEKDEEEEEEEKKEEYQKGIFLCEKCGYIIDETNEDFEKNQSKKIKRDENENILKCPNCGALGKYLKRISKEEKEKILRKRKSEKEKEEDRKLKIARGNIKDDMLDLLEDLRYRLENDEISIKRFTALFINLSKKIIDRNAKDINIDWLEYRRAIFGMADAAISLYNIKEDAESIIEDYEENIEEDKLYLAEYKYYIEDDKFAIPDYEMQERIEEYDKMQNNLFKEERQKALEEEYQKRKIAFEKKADDRIQRRIERSL